MEDEPPNFGDGMQDVENNGDGSLGPDQQRRRLRLGAQQHLSSICTASRASEKAWSGRAAWGRASLVRKSVIGAGC